MAENLQRTDTTIGGTRRGALCDAQNLVAFMATKTLHVSELQRIKPELRRVVIFGDVDVRRFIAVSHKKEKAVAALAENGGHTAKLRTWSDSASQHSRAARTETKLAYPA